MHRNQKHWFAARTRNKQEIAIHTIIEKLKVEKRLDITCYLPTKVIIRQLKYRKKTYKIPAIKNLIFIQATKQVACDIANKYGIQLFFMKDLFTHSMLIIPEKQMEDFILVMSLASEGVSFNNEHLSIGNKVKVIRGNFTGIEGEIATEANKTYVVIRIKNILTASIKVPKSYLKAI